MVVRTARREEDRFAFGQNWRDFSFTLDADKIMAARAGLARLLRRDDLSGRSFLDIGSGSGLMSLAAHQMGARVVAFDYDHDAVATSIAVRNAGAGPDAYPVLQGSVLDAAFVAGLGTFDVAYAWGVLHHTGELWRACETVAKAVAPAGMLALAVYNDQGLPSRVWARVKKTYVDGGPLRRRALVSTYGLYFRSQDMAVQTLLHRPKQARPRGMDRQHDLVDWVGGYPFEVAKPEEVFDFFHTRGFALEGLTTCRGGLGCNEFLFSRAIGRETERDA